jgi:hypothetical protein
MKQGPHSKIPVVKNDFASRSFLRTSSTKNKRRATKVIDGTVSDLRKHTHTNLHMHAHSCSIHAESDEYKRLLHTVDDFKAAEVCKTLWSFATVGMKPAEGLIE